MLRSLSRAVAVTVKPTKCMITGMPAIALGMLVRHNGTYIKNNTLRETASAGPVDITPLRLSNELYAEFRVHGRPYVVTEGDKVILPYKVKNAEVGDILALTDVRTIGSRNYKLVDEPIDPSLYNLKATVLEKSKRKFEIREVTKRRNRRVRHAKRKGDLTMIRISELSVN
ncbi:similar to Saccharomyces cerevisiae YJL096W MRPL49 Mitochondrial ribosomal protein of the large subunit [Maudiozyma barnettii]|uniref:Large ribosomal subunit protein bL21m n=1 Tax=Maudiozyma barnettii TaxID=61262 RepID=A0A8H2ZII5_9SACH|nr:mitochondrial 54S ribosomal protein YmL49 [Kazachstania barnettii]CAB4256959.1 similar to Saccharomyces cerevisiae YJL096W MRPL49 Mitochondrial ribosomal protein of the large subunit [Kazachstania barnettii]CAD1785564.1 similar to Saccharomyces cerevisiae YJL096W MRPL49 Mitochondrial ribosomal protein of the large subunit [Kazachstania barnettii]